MSKNGAREEEEEKQHSWQRSQHVQRHGGGWYFSIWHRGPAEQL